MGDDLPQEEINFVGEDVLTIMKDSVEHVLQSQNYHHLKVAQWTANIVEQCLKRLASNQRPFKYIVTCVIMQKNGAGLHTATSCYWDNSTDGSCTYRWENKTMYCITTVYGLAI